MVQKSKQAFMYPFLKGFDVVADVDTLNFFTLLSVCQIVLLIALAGIMYTEILQTLKILLIAGLFQDALVMVISQSSISIHCCQSSLKYQSQKVKLIK